MRAALLNRAETLIAELICVIGELRRAEVSPGPAHHHGPGERFSFPSDVALEPGSAAAEAPVLADVSSLTAVGASVSTSAPAALSGRKQVRHLSVGSPERARMKAEQAAEAAKYIGVKASKLSYSFEAQISLPRGEGQRYGSLKYLGSFATAEAAARARDAVAAPLGRKLNFLSEHPVEQNAHPGQAEVVAAGASVTGSGVHAGRDESRGARPAVISPDAMRGQTLPHTAEATALSPEGSVAKIGQGAALSKDRARRYVAPAPVKEPLAPAPVQRPTRQIVIAPTRSLQGNMDEAERLLASRPARGDASIRAQEEAQIAAFLAQRGALVLPPTGPCEPGQEQVQTDALAAARQDLIDRAALTPGTHVTYGVGAGPSRYSRSGVVSEKLSKHPNRVAIDIVTDAGVTETKEIHRSQVSARHPTPSSTGEKP